MIYTWSNIIQTCGHASVLILIIVSPNRLPQVTASFGRLSKEWTPALCTSCMYIVSWPWLQCQRKFVSADVSCNTFSFDWHNQCDKRPYHWSKSNFSKCGIKAKKHGCTVLPKIYKHTTRCGGKIHPPPNCSKTASDTSLWRHQRTKQQQTAQSLNWFRVFQLHSWLLAALSRTWNKRITRGKVKSH